MNDEIIRACLQKEKERQAEWTRRMAEKCHQDKWKRLADEHKHSQPHQHHPVIPGQSRGK
jgi:hypothetical protein